jgi:beta-galactosidase/beta-glucuronidase
MASRQISYIVILLCVLSASGWSQKPDLRRFISLRGTWKFELGDDARRANPDFDDGSWDHIRVPAPWEEEGYPGYDGYAWYRKHFDVDNDARFRTLYLRLGYVDDACEVFLNGHLIGRQGAFPPRFETAYSVAFEFPIPKEFLRYGSDNVIAVKVYDYYQAGGITHGDVGVYELRNALEPDLDLSGQWKFRTGDDESWAGPTFDDSKWQLLKVPLLWDAQGFKEYDGIAWYRVKFKVPADLAGRRIVLLLGRIDDFDEAYVNGELVGRTGRIRLGLTGKDQRGEHQQQRAYAISASLLKPNEENTLAVRVQDVWRHGGIYDGPVGLILRDRYQRWREHPNSLGDYLRQLFE